MNRKWKVSWVEGVFLVIVVGFMLLFLLPAVRLAREAKIGLDCKNNLKQVGLALLMYHDAYGSLPPAYTVDAAGNRLHSWRTLLLPFLEQGKLYDQIDLSKPWNDPVHQQVRQGSIPPVYVCTDSRHKDKTHVMVVVAPASAFPDSHTLSFDEMPDRANTLLVFEAPEEQALEWMSPYDADPNLFTNMQGQALNHSAIYAVMADGTRLELPVKATSADLQRMISIAAD